MKACILASGSKGNITYIETNSHKILLDMGKNMKYIENSLKQIDVSAKDIDIILISHLHKDHISALETFERRYHPTICMPKDMANSLESTNTFKDLYIYDSDIELDSLKIKSLKSSHDSIDSRNFVFEEGNESLVQITDTGYIKSKYFNILKNKNVYFLESNHDIEMLTKGPYPDWLKKRVLSDEGHLSNQAAGFYLSKLIGDKTKKVYLMHLSEVNNDSKIALKTVKDTLNKYDIDFKNIKCAEQDNISDVIVV